MGKANIKWERVHGPDLDPNNGIRAAVNQKILKSEIFIDACKRANIIATKRQASKWNKKRGLAFKMKE